MWFIFKSMLSDNHALSDKTPSTKRPIFKHTNEMIIYGNIGNDD